jgi:hypothetical protein
MSDEDRQSHLPPMRLLCESLNQQRRDGDTSVMTDWFAEYAIVNGPLSLELAGTVTVQ